jgi:glutamyl-tRNA(Gln) amidotransferase subunit D
MGVIPGRNLLPETAYIKLGWVLGQTNNPEEVKSLLLENVAGEFLEREIPIAFNYDIDELLKSEKL